MGQIENKQQCGRFTFNHIDNSITCKWFKMTINWWRLSNSEKKRQVPTICSLQETYIKYKYRCIKSKRMGKEDHPNNNQK